MLENSGRSRRALGCLTSSSTKWSLRDGSKTAFCFP